jgi:biopolymer transport protein ExbD
MSFGSMDRNGSQAPMAEINVVPLVDVMLVLLVIFIITAPLLTHSVKVDLPKASSSPNITKPEHVELGIKGDKSLFLNGEPIALVQLATRFSEILIQDPTTELHIRSDGQVPYEHVAQVMSIASKAGLIRIGFVTDPSK